ncbi:hypothetical protein ACJX0J_021203, partial [Zea mays]
MISQEAHKQIDGFIEDPDNHATIMMFIAPRRSKQLKKISRMHMMAVRDLLFFGYAQAPLDTFHA